MAELVCLMLLSLRPVSHSEALSTCVQVYLAAEVAGEDPIEVAAQAGRESGWDARAVSPAGCRGALQVTPRHFCPGGKLKGCDLIAAGIAARKAWREGLRRRGRSTTKTEVLCAYLRGYAHPRGESCAYARNVLALAARARRSL
jgi:hypothetical protein